MCDSNDFGALAQLGARHTGSVEVTGSNPVCSIFIFSFFYKEFKTFKHKENLVWELVENLYGNGYISQTGTDTDSQS